MLSPSTASFSTWSNMLRYIYAISRFHRSVLDFSYFSKKWLIWHFSGTPKSPDLLYNLLVG